MSNTNDEKEAIVDAVRQIAEAFDARSLEALLHAHYQGAECSVIFAGGERASGWEAVRENLELRMNEFQYSRTRISDLNVTLMEGLAVVTYMQSVESRVHDIDFSSEAWVTDVLLRENDRWLRLHHHASDRK